MSRDFRGLPFASLPEPTAPDFTPRLRNMFALIEEWAKDQSAGNARIIEGDIPTGAGTSIVVAGSSDPTLTLGDMVYNNGSTLARLPIGATGQVLKTAGGIPSWSNTGSPALRSVFLPAEAFAPKTKTTSGTPPDIYQMSTFAGGGVATQMVTTLIVPNDFSATGNFSIYYTSQGVSTNAVVWNIYALALVAGSSVSAAYSGTDHIVSTPSGVVDQLEVASGTTAIGAVAGAGNVVRLVIERDPADASDTNADTMNFLGVLFTYIPTI